MREKSIIFVILLFFLWSYNSAATVYYVDATCGNDSNDGKTPQTAWKTIGHVNNHWGVFQPGDDLLLKRGETFIDHRLVIETGGTNSDYLVIGAYGNGPKPILGNPAGGIYCSKKGLSYIKIKDISIVQSVTGQSILFGANNCSNIEIINVEIDGNKTRNGILLNKIDTYTIRDCVIRNCGNCGINVCGSSNYPITNGTIINNTIYNIRGNDGITLHHSGDGYDVGPNHELINNKCFNCHEEGIDINSGNHIIIRNNETYNNGQAGVVIDNNPNDVWIDKHYSHNEQGNGIQIEECSKVKLTNSIIYNVSYHSLTIGISWNNKGRYCKNIEIYNNMIIHRNSSSIVDIYANVNTVKFKNNIVACFNNETESHIRFLKATPRKIGIEFDHNIWCKPKGDIKFSHPVRRKGSRIINPIQLFLNLLISIRNLIPIVLMLDLIWD